MSTNETNCPKGEMTAAAAGKRGGEATKASRPASYYRDIGKKGGEATKARHEPDYYVALCRRAYAAKLAPPLIEFSAGCPRASAGGEMCLSQCDTRPPL